MQKTRRKWLKRFLHMSTKHLLITNQKSFFYLYFNCYLHVHLLKRGYLYFTNILQNKNCNKFKKLIKSNEKTHFSK